IVELDSFILYEISTFDCTTTITSDVEENNDGVETFAFLVIARWLMKRYVMRLNKVPEILIKILIRSIRLFRAHIKACPTPKEYIIIFGNALLAAPLASSLAYRLLAGLGPRRLWHLDTFYGIFVSNKTRYVIVYCLFHKAGSPSLWLLLILTGALVCYYNCVRMVDHDQCKRDAAI
ncbi:hypothetical protein SFRURICE_002607, partial [Spodoptera frugiperda]